MIDDVRVEDIGKHPDEPLSPVRLQDLVPLPPPYDKFDEETEWKEIKDTVKDGLVCNLDGVVASPLPKPKDAAEEKEYVDKFIAGLKRSSILIDRKQLSELALHDAEAFRKVVEEAKAHQSSSVPPGTDS